MQDAGKSGPVSAACDSRLRVLFVTQHLPVPVRGGSSQRTNILIEALGTFADVELLAIGAPAIADLLESHGYVVAGVIPASDGGQFAVLKKAIGLLFPQLLRYRPKPETARKLASLIETRHYDIVIGRYCRNAAQAGVHLIPGAIIDVDDLESQKLSSWLTSRFGQRGLNSATQFIVGRMQAAERHVIKRLGRAWLSAAEDEVDLPAGRVDVVPNIPFYASGEVGPSPSAGKILFVASFDYRVNANALRRVIDHLWPAVHKRAPHLTLRVVGGGLPQSIQAQIAQSPGVEYVGFAEDLKVEYEKALCSIVPIWEGGGTKIKILESLAWNRTCVVSKPSMRGYESYLHHEESVLVAETEKDFIDSIVRLDNDELERRQMEIKGRAIVCQHFSREYVNEQVHNSVSQALISR